MAGISIDASELNRLAVDLGNAGQSAGERASQVVRKSAARVESEAKMFAPVDTGNLRNSIGTDIDPDGLGAVVGPTASYGVFLEFGTSRMAPRAFLGPAFDRAQPDFITALEQIAREVLRPTRRSSTPRPWPASRP
jgi:HK97 gp10 family phage protein